jgi:hypothetical protein
MRYLSFITKTDDEPCRLIIILGGIVEEAKFTSLRRGYTDEWLDEN